MINKSENTFLSSDGQTKIYVKSWIPDETQYPKPVAVLQIAHGMIEHIDRYDEFATYMAERGILVSGNDHLGHGHSVTSEENLGYFSKKNEDKVLVKDMYHLNRILKKKYNDVPMFIVGHSMGSFMTRRFLMTYPEAVDGAIILGTGNQSRIVVRVGLLLNSIIGLIKGDRYRSYLMTGIMFGSYNKRTANRTNRDWLSRDEKKVDEYLADPFSRFMFTINGYSGMLKTILYVTDKKNIKKLREDMPVLLASGDSDPVGEYGKAVARVYKEYHEYIDDIELNLYEECRHELQNELNREEFFADIYDWLTRHI